MLRARYLIRKPWPVFIGSVTICIVLRSKNQKRLSVKLMLSLNTVSECLAYGVKTVAIKLRQGNRTPGHVRSGIVRCTGTATFGDAEQSCRTLLHPVSNLRQQKQQRWKCFDIKLHNELRYFNKIRVLHTLGSTCFIFGCLRKFYFDKKGLWTPASIHISQRFAVLPIFCPYAQIRIVSSCG
jgi:hypothetical protein